MTRARQTMAAGVMLLAALPARADWKDARQTAVQACQMCHAAGMLAQQRLVRAQWDKTVAKMAKWGPELEEGEPEDLSSYLSGPHSPAASPQRPVLLTKAELMARLAPERHADRGHPEAGAAVYAKDCAVCHGKDARGLKAPALIGRPVLARPSEWAKVIRDGRRRMPAYDDRLSSEQIQDMLVWVRRASREAVEPKVSP